MKARMEPGKRHSAAELRQLVEHSAKLRLRYAESLAQLQKTILERCDLLEMLNAGTCPNPQLTGGWMYVSAADLANRS